MTHSYISGSSLGKRLRQLGLTALLAGGTTLAAQAQFSYNPIVSYNVAGTYTDLGTTGTAITTANNDDANSAAQNIGFTFNYNGTAFTQFVLNTNGLVRLGSVAPSATNMFANYEGGANVGVDPISSTNAADVNLLMPFNFDLQQGTSAAEYRVATTGTAPNRVCTVQWKNVSDKADASPSQYTNFTFQLKIYETSNTIEFVYNTATASANTATGRFPTVGIKGSDSTNDILVSKTSSLSAWSTSTFITGTYAASTHNFRSVVGPDAGRTYRFIVQAANDAAVYSVYTLGKLPTVALPHSVQAYIVNTGSSTLSNLSVVLNVTGANTFTNTQAIATLAPGASATVAFSSLPTTLVAGVNTVTVSVPADGYNGNNSVAVQQTVNTTGAFSYIPTDMTTMSVNSLGAGTPTSGLLLATKYTTVTTGTVTAVSAYIQDVNSVGKTLSGVVLSTAGAILGQSAAYVVQASDINTYHTFTIPTPPTIAANSSFLGGLVQAAQSGTAYYPLGVQTESPGRTGIYYITSPAGGTLTDVNASGGTYRFMTEAVVTRVLATSKELQRAVTVYPNPSETGIFNLDIQNANAMGNLGVDVTNQLGQRVYAGSARDNFTTKLDLSNLAPGIYHLQVRNGQDYMSSQISIVK